MSIPVLIETYEEVRRLAIAGSVVAPGDFRLKKLLPQLDQAGKKAPVFAKVGEAAARLVESNEKTSAAALLELATLVNAILYTQGETRVQGELAPVPTVDIGPITTQTSARLLKSLQDALTTSGPGRLEMIRDGFERGAFPDLRLIKPAVAALDDTYSEIADFVAESILPLYGRAILPELQAAFDPKGKAGHARRLRAMHRLDPDGGRAYVRRGLDEGSKEVRIAAIDCLGDSPEDLPVLLEQRKAKASEVRTAASKALGRSDSPDAAQVLCEALTGADLPLAVEPLRATRNPVVVGLLLQEAEKQFGTLVASRRKDAKELGGQNSRMCLLLECLGEREDNATEKLLLWMLERLAELSNVRGEPSGKDVAEKLVETMVSGPPAVRSALVDAHATLPAESLLGAFVAACRCRKPLEVYAIFSPYLTAKVDEKKKDRDPAYAKREALIHLLVGRKTLSGKLRSGDLDPRWLDLAVESGRVDLVLALAVPEHAGANALLAEQFHEELGEGRFKPLLFGILDTMVRIGHPEATAATIELIKRSARSSDYLRHYWIGALTPRLPPAEAIPKLEALLPTLPENMIDPLLGHITKLKEQSAAPL
jgi:HEAT repeats